MQLATVVTGYRIIRSARQLIKTFSKRRTPTGGLSLKSVSQKQNPKVRIRYLADGRIIILIQPPLKETKQ